MIWCKTAWCPTTYGTTLVPPRDNEIPPRRRREALASEQMRMIALLSLEYRGKDGGVITQPVRSLKYWTRKGLDSMLQAPPQMCSRGIARPYF